MGYSVSWSPAARTTYLRILEYLDERWTVKELKAFVKRTELVIKYICDNPLLYPYSLESDTHRCVVIKQISLFYRVRGSTVELLVFWDNRRDPANLLI